MKILILADPAATHTIKWVNALNERGFDIFLFGLSVYNPDFYNKNITIRSLNLPESVRDNIDGSLYKLLYFKAVVQIRRIIRQFGPDILHAHYASSFGLLGALSDFHPFIVSVWGSDVYTFPSSFLRRAMLRFTFSKADKILSTSRAMKKETNQYTDKEIGLTPFGIDVTKYYPEPVAGLFNKGDIVIGTVKTLKKNYGIEYLVRAFHLLKVKFPAAPLKLLIVGGGDQMDYLKNLAGQLGIMKYSLFTGFINPNEVAAYHNMLDIYVAPSIKESFGVAILEASACGKPVVVSNVGGLPEVVDDGITGYVTEKGDPEKLADKIEKLLFDENLRIRLGQKGREKVMKDYNWNESVETMVVIYNGFRDGSSNG
jgi:glycosyltransferase involved in cell wall biosynthesis